MPSAEEARAELARRHFTRFVREAWPIVEPGTPLVWGWHIDAICEHLQAVAEGQIKRLLINIPPGHSKSLIVSVLWPAWVWTRRPEWRGLFASYANNLSVRDSVRCRIVIDSPWYRRHFMKGWDFADDQNVKLLFQNTRLGFRQALSVDGGGTGHRGDAIVCDDPLNALDAYSKPARERAILWWDKTMSSRLNRMEDGVKVIIMQRLHEEDLAGHVLKQGGYEHLCLPSEFDPARRSSTSVGWQDPRTGPGELLFPALFPKHVLAQAKVDMGSDAYAGQHQQSPISDTGNIFKREWWKTYRAAPADLDELVQSWDFTFKDSDGTDFVVGQVWGRKGGQFYLLDQVRDRMDFVAALAAIKALSTKWPKARRKLIEDKANGPAIMSALKTELPGMVPVEPYGNKEARARAITPYVEAGNVFLPEGVPWLSDYLAETQSFPRGANDDQVDATSQALVALGEAQSALSRLKKLASY